MQDGWTPLHFASYWGSHRVMKELLELGADTELEDFVRPLCQHFRLFMQKQLPNLSITHSHWNAAAQEDAITSSRVARRRFGSERTLHIQGQSEQH